MSDHPTVLVLEDERLQLLSIRAQIHSIGNLVEFTRATEALAFARERPVDAVIADIRMEGQEMDGLDFIRGLRGFDPDVSVIIRTGDESEDIIDGAIELRAMRRFIKGRPISNGLCRCTLAAIAETAARRRHTRVVSEASKSQANLVDALGTFDSTLTAATIYRGLVHSMRNDLNCLNVLAEVFKDQLDQDSSLAGLAGKNEKIVARMIRALDGVLDGPFGAEGEIPPASVNRTIASLRTHFAGAAEWIAIGKSVNLHGLTEDVFVDCAPVTLFNGLKHLIEFALARIPAGRELSLISVIAQPSVGEFVRSEKSRVVVDAGLPTNRYCIAFHIRGDILASAAAEVLDFANGRASSLRTGNLAVCDQMLAVAHGALLVIDTSSNSLALEAILPIYT